MIKIFYNLTTGLIAAAAIVLTVFYGFSLPIALIILEGVK